MIVELLDEFIEAEFEKCLTRNLTVVLGEHAHPFDFILKGLLVFLPPHQVFYFSFTHAWKIDHFLHLCLIFWSEHPSLLHQDFSIVPISVSPLQVLIRGFLHVHLDVLKGVLLDVPDT